MSSETIEQLIERLAGAVMGADANAAGLASLEPLLAELDGALATVAAKEPLAIVRKASQALVDLKAIAPVEALKFVSDAVSQLQQPQGTPAEAQSSSGSGVARHIDRDEQTLELVRDFLQEAGDGLGTADEILLNIESAGLTPNKVNALFRVFHTIKGVAGFLELTEIVSLAHSTESLMNDVREGKRTLAGEALELVFNSTALLRKLLDGVKAAVEAGLEFRPSFETPPLVAKIDALMEAELESAPEQAPAPMPPPVELASTGVTAAPLASAPSAPMPSAPKAPVASAPMPPVPSAPMPPLASASVSSRPTAPGFDPLPSAPGPSASAPVPSPSAPEGGSVVASGGAKLRETVKVDLERVDGMVEMIGELIIVESMLVHAPEISSLASLRVRNTLNQLGKISRDLQNAAMRMRTVPVHNTFMKMARLTREVGRKAGKEVVLTTQGEGTEMDRAMVERLEDPLVHMVRNACDHGVEPAAERVRLGKPPVGTLNLSASHKGGSIIIELTDDGRGLQRDVILKKAIEKGLVKNADGMTESDIFALIFAPGFSTAAKVTEVSGRGVGMDVVKRNIESMRGRVVITSEPGKGSTFQLVLPLTLAIIDGMLVTVGRERYLIPSLSIVEALQPTRAMLSSMGARDELLTIRGQVMPMIRMSTLLGVEGARTDPADALVVVVESVGKRVGLLVDQVVAQQQVVIKPLGVGVGNAEFYAGAAILSDGLVGLILNIDRVCGLVSYRHHSHRADPRHERKNEEARP